jgi:hypothetical protein
MLDTTEATKPKLSINKRSEILATSECKRLGINLVGPGAVHIQAKIRRLLMQERATGKKTGLFERLTGLDNLVNDQPVLCLETDQAA